MAKKNTGKTYEELVQEIYQAILDYENQDAGYKRIEVQHNVELQGKTGNMHQIDVYWSFILGGIEYKTLVEVKDWKSPVKKEQLHSFKSVLDDIPGSPRGCYVSKSGFQKGAEVVARHHGIKLMKIEEEELSLRMVLASVVTYYEGVELAVDENWVEQEGLTDADLSGLNKGITQETAILLNPQETKVRLYDLMCNDARPYYFTDDNERHIITTNLEDNWYWVTNDLRIPKVKITQYKFACYNRCASTKMEIIRKGLPQYLITDILDEKKYLYDVVTKAIKLNIA